MNATSDTATSDTATLARMRMVLAVIAVATALGGLVELGLLRHWGETTQLLPWIALSMVAIAGVAVARGAGSDRIVQAIGAGSLLIGGIGVFLHLSENLDAGEDLAQYAQTWDTMPFFERLWLALNGTVGEAPLLAPGMVALAGVLLFVSVLDRRR